MKKAIISIVVIVLIAGAAFAERPKTAVFVGCTGYLISETQKIATQIHGAEISVITSQGDTLRTVSDETASFVIPQTPEGPATVKVEAEGYKTQIQILDIRANRAGRYVKNFFLEKSEAAANGETDKPKQE